MELDALDRSGCLGGERKRGAKENGHSVDAAGLGMAEGARARLAAHAVGLTGHPAGPHRASLRRAGRPPHRGGDPVIAPLACGLVEVTDTIVFTAGSRLAAIYGVPRAVEGYHCRYGLNAAYAARLEAGPLKVAARDGAGEVRAVKLEGHPFFVATLFQPERSALAGRAHSPITAFAIAAGRRSRTS